MRDETLYNVVLILAPGEDGAERAPIALTLLTKPELPTAIRATLESHKLTPEDVTSIVRSPVQSFEEFFSNDDVE